MSPYTGKERAYANQPSNHADGPTHDPPFVIKTIDDFVNAEAAHTLKIWRGRINHTPAVRVEIPDWDEFIKHRSLLYQMRVLTGTNVELYEDADPAHWMLKHPNHDRKFFSENLRCRKCVGQCPMCRKPCCKFKRACHLSKFEGSSHNIKQTMDLILECTPNGGVDESTFVKCTKCKSHVCTDCFGVCPECFEPMCKKCNVLQFTVCPRHVGYD